MTSPAISSPLLASTTLSAATPAAGTTREDLAGAARQFEAIFLRQMLSAARETNFGESLFSGSQAMGTFRQMRDERFADIASDTGAFGLAKMIETHLARFVPDNAAESDAAESDTAATNATGAIAMQKGTGNGI
jgi:peptidoglycan hydrolase FlgJ